MIGHCSSAMITIQIKADIILIAIFLQLSKMVFIPSHNRGWLIQFQRSQSAWKTSQSDKRKY